MGDEEYKSVLIVNDSADTHVTFYLYHRWDFICWLSLESKILKPGEKYLHRSKKRFRFEIAARFQDDQQSKTILETQQWDGDKLFKITGTTSPTVTEEALTDQVEKRICLRKVQRNKELKITSGGRNFYEILGLDIKKVRKMSKEEQAKEIKKGYLTQMHIWHPDRNGGDEEIAKEILFAYETLQNEEKRACYNNLTDYDGGWLSLRRYKAIFKPECATEKQTKAYRKRMFLFAMSALLVVGGFVSISTTAGLALIFGGAAVGAGFQSLQHTLKAESIIDGCSFKDWSGKAGIGFVAGASTGGATLGIYIAVPVECIGRAAITGAIGGVASSLATDACRRFVEGKDVTEKQAAFRALCGGVVSSVASVLGVVVTQAAVGQPRSQGFSPLKRKALETRLAVAPKESAAAANFKGEIGEEAATLTGARCLGKFAARNIPRKLAENGAEAVVSGPLQVVEERLDGSAENQSLRTHMVNGIKNAAGKISLGFANAGVAVFVSHAINEIQVDQEFKNEKTDAKRSGSKPFPQRSEVRFRLYKDERHNWKAGNCSSTYSPLNTEETPDLGPENLHSLSEELNLVERETDGQPKDGKVKYISNGAWFSKMVVTFFENSEKVTEEVKGSGRSINIPSSAREIEVKFQVRRPFWGDICKYDRFNKSWFRPDEPHIFRYDTPPIRTFTISGNLWWEAVMRVSDEYHEETEEM